MTPPSVSSGWLRELAAEAAALDERGFDKRGYPSSAIVDLKNLAPDLAALCADMADALESISQAWDEGRSAQMAPGIPLAVLLARFAALNTGQDTQ